MRQLVFILLLGCFAPHTQAQYCSPRKFDSTRTELLVHYTTSGFQKGRFIDSKGVVMLRITRDSLETERWYLTCIIDDRYKDDLPNAWAEMGSIPILINDETIPSSTKDRKRRLACLDELIGDKLYLRPKPREMRVQVTDVHGNPTLDRKGKPVYSSNKFLMAGNTHNDLIIEFYKDGSYKKLIPV